MSDNQLVHILKDKRVNCYSIITSMSVKDYLQFVQDAYEKKGGIDKQRESLRKTTAIRIRNRMIEDLKAGAVLPPIVLGMIADSQVIKGITDHKNNFTYGHFQEMIKSIPKEHISIIDGMQRTSALIEARNKVEQILNNDIRVEYWIASSTNHLIYRMLVLNTGQVPWRLEKQVEAIYDSLIKEIQEKVPSIHLIKSDVPEKREESGTYLVKDIVELFLAFGDRKEKLNMAERLAEEFTRLDIIQAASKEAFLDMFYQVLQLLVAFDNAFGRLKVQASETKFKEGKDIFASHPPQIGFMVAYAQAIMGRVGSREQTEEEHQKTLEQLIAYSNKLLQKIKAMPEEQLAEFLDLTTLDENISRRIAGKKIGDFEREFFLEAFQTLIKQQFEVDTLTSCWRAYR